MAGETPAEAVQNYVDPLQKAVSCVTKAVLDVSGGYYASDKPHSLAFGGGLPQRLSGSNLYLSIVQLYRVVEDEDLERGLWRATITQYVYTLRRASTSWESDKPETLISYQWHPRPGARYNYPHLHLGAASGIGPAGESLLSNKSHIPTGRIAVEDVIRFAISQLGVRPLREDWSEVLDETQGRHERYRSWGGSRPTA